MSGRPSSSAPAASGLVLLADDSESVRAALSTILAAEGYRVATVDNGLDALAGVVEHQPSVVVLDADMPRLDGYRTAALIRSQPEYAEVAVILLSGAGSISDTAMAGLAACDAHVSKGSDATELLAAIEQVLAREQNVHQAAATTSAAEMVCPD